MKLSRKEMTILSVFLFFVIIAVGAFLFVLPEYEKVEPNKVSLQAARDEKDRIYASLERENTIDQEIQDAIAQANTLSLYFYDDMTEYEADVIVREILAASNMHTNSLSLGSFTTSTLTVSDYVETAVTYPLKEYAGVTGDNIDASGFSLQYDEEGRVIVPQVYLDKYGEEQALTEYLTALLTTQSQTIGAITATFTVTGTRGDFLNFLNYVANLEKSTKINSTTVAYTSVVSDSTPAMGGEAAEGEEGEEPTESVPPVNTSSEQQLNDDSQISANISMTFYCVPPMKAQETTEAESEPEPAE